MELGIAPSVYHLNDGHSALAPLEVIRQSMKADGLTFDDALRETSRRTLFTTHTSEKSDLDRFDGGAVEEHLGPLRDELNVSYQQMMGLGRAESQDEDEGFCPAVAGLKLSRRANTVSAAQAQVARKTWAHLWPWRVEEEVPIGHITNGVHVPTWLASPTSQLYDRQLTSDWQQRLGESEVWQAIRDVDPADLWETHQEMKKQLLEFARRRISRQFRRRNESDDVIESARKLLDPHSLTIGFAADFASHQRADLIFSDCQRLAKLLSHDERPVQLLFAGKANPKDEVSKKFLQKIANLQLDERFSGRIAFIEDYDINVARHMSQGIDVWLSNPRRHLGAMTLGGQKAVINGGLNLSTLDGWWAEAFNGENGFAIGTGSRHVSDEVNDHRDANSLYRVLENEVVPLFYNRETDYLPRQWIERIVNSIATLAWRCNAQRMVDDYTRACYVPAAGGLSCEIR